jgi:hypothetical protein
VSIALGEVVASETRYLNNISEGGLAFDSLLPLAVGTMLRISLPVVRPLFTVQGRVAWCRAAGVKYEIGLEFLDPDTEKRQRIVALVRYVDEYRKRAAANGRTLSDQEATIEWLDRFGAVLFGEKRPVVR